MNMDYKELIACIDGLRLAMEALLKRVETLETKNALGKFECFDGRTCELEHPCLEKCTKN